MTGLWILLTAAGALALLALLMGLARALLSRDRLLADAAITNLRDRTTVDERTGAMRSVQTADLLLSERALSELWSPMHLERLARTYWRFLTRVTLGLVRVRYTEGERFVVLLFRPLTLLAFSAPEYEIQADHGVVRWRIERGLLVARAGRESKGHLQIDVRRLRGARRERPRGSAPAHRGGGRQLPPRDRLEDQPPPLQRDPVAHPRDRHPRLPALARAPGPGGPDRVRPARGAPRAGQGDPELRGGPTPVSYPNRASP